MSQRLKRQERTDRLVACRLIKVAMIVLVSAASSSANVSRAVYLDRPDRGSLVLELNCPHFLGSDLSLTTVGAFATARIPMSDRVLFVVDVPYARTAIRESALPGHFFRPIYEESGSTVGNIYLGVEFPSEAGTTVDVGVRFNTISDQEDRAARIGQAADLTRPAAFERGLGVALSLAVAGRTRHSSGLETTMLIGPYVFVPAGQCGGDLPIGLLQYGGSFGVAAQKMTIRAGLTGLMAATVSGGSFAERTIHHGGLNISFHTGAWRPGAGIRVRLDDVPYSRGQDYTLGLNLVYALK